MSLTPISQYNSTASTILRITNNVSPRVQVQSPKEPAQTLKAPVQTLASGTVLQANGHSTASSAPGKSSLNVEYDRLTRQTDIGPSSTNGNAAIQSFLSSYDQNSGNGASLQSSGSLFRTIA